MYEMNVQGVAVSARVTFRMAKGTNKCTATVSPNFNSNRISFTGNLYPRASRMCSRDVLFNVDKCSL